MSIQIRNDRPQAVILVPQGMMAIIEMTHELKEKGYEFECIAATTTRIDLGMEIEAYFEFRKKFGLLSAELFAPMRLLHLVLPILTPNEGAIRIRQVEMFPIEIWTM